MKTSQELKLFFLSCSLLLFFSCSESNQRHLGEWKGTDNSGNKGSLILDKNNHAVMVMGNEEMGGAESEINGVKYELKYEIDY